MVLKLKHHFDAAHRLDFHQGLCRNLHGHRWDIEVEINQDPAATGLIVDFGEIKRVINEFDHSTILLKSKENKPLIDYLESMKMKVIVLDVVPTAENLSQIIRSRIGESLGIRGYLKVRLWESPGALIEA